MFSRLANVVSRHPFAVIFAWIALVVVLKFVTPAWDDVTLDGDLAHLPPHMASIRGQELMNAAFPDQQSQSQVVVVIAREDQPLSAADREFAAQVAQRFEALQQQGELPITSVWSHKSEVVGRMLRSRDEQAVLVMLRLENEFMATDNIRVLSIVQNELDALWEHAPQGLKHGISGSAAIGGDMLTSAAESIENTETTTIVLVVLILLLVYRAPLLVIIPLVAIWASVSVATSLAAAMTQLDQLTGFGWWDMKIFKTTKIFVVVILFGAGTDYCLFLIARYKEELAKGLTTARAVARSLSRVGEALVASALTTIVGLAMMYFAEFGKFSSSGPVIALCLTVALLACITLAPALMCAMGSVVFWPFGKSSLARIGPSENDDLQPAGSLVGRFWHSSARMILAHPGLILAASVLVMLPLAWKGTSVDITYDLLGELRRDRPSVIGTNLLHRHFPAGETGPITVLAHLPSGEFDTREGENQITRLTQALFQIPGVVSVRSMATPTGEPPQRRSLFGASDWKTQLMKVQEITKETFVSREQGWEGEVARFDLILNADPFSREAIELLNLVETDLEEIKQAPQSDWQNARFEFAGTTAGIRDLKRVTGHDQQLIQVLVVVAVLAVLLVILRRPGVCLYLILSVLFSYFVTIGATQFFFEWMYGETYHGLDWKVPIFLFVILIAVGEDYNIYLVTRIFEEQRRRGAMEGLRVALIQTGGIITSCGMIMAGTFVSMMTGTLRGMLELGFALSLGVLLDTFVIRTVLVPAFFALIGRRKPGPPPADVQSRDREMVASGHWVSHS